jgi:hypothetical protein
VRSITFPSAGCNGTVAFPSASRANGPLSLTTTVIDLVMVLPSLSFVVYVTATVWPSVELAIDERHGILRSQLRMRKRISKNAMAQEWMHPRDGFGGVKRGRARRDSVRGQSGLRCR